MNELLTFRGRREYLFGRRASGAFFFFPLWGGGLLILSLARCKHTSTSMSWIAGTFAAWLLVLILSTICRRWLKGPHAAIELSRDPRRARCWWKSAITGREKERFYDIPDSACVVYRQMWNNGEDGDGSAMHSVWIEGVPRDFDIFQFAVFSRGRKDGDPCGLAAHVAEFLGLQAMREGSDRPWTPRPRKKRGARPAGNRRR